MAGEPTPILPAYGEGCLTDVVPALLRRRNGTPAWLPEPAAEAAAIVLLTLDGLGWEQLQDRLDVAPTLVGMAGGPITTVAPSTTATALTSLTTGAPPAVHGVLGYRIRVAVDGEGPGEVLNVLRWTTPAGDARERVPPESIQPLEPFLGSKPAVVTRGDFSDTGFTRAHLAGSELCGWRAASSLVVRSGQLVAAGRPFVYAYYPGIDTVAHEFGFGELYDAELRAADRMVADLLEVLPPEAALVVVADHGQLDVGESMLAIAPEVAALTVMLSGEARFRWLHARPGAGEDLLAAARHHHGEVAWVLSRDEVVAAGWLGGTPRPEVAARLGDVALVAFAPVGFVDPADTGFYELRCRHGSLTSSEMLVPLVAARGRLGER